MGVFAKWRASFLYGRALRRFYQKNYLDAARLLQKVCELDPHHERNELYHSYLGRSYLSLGRYDDALQVLCRAYEPFRKRSQQLDTDFGRQEYVDTLNALSDVLHKVGQSSRAREVAHEAEEYLINTGRYEKGHEK